MLPSLWVTAALLSGAQAAVPWIVPRIDSQFSNFASTPAISSSTEIPVNTPTSTTGISLATSSESTTLIVSTPGSEITTSTSILSTSASTTAISSEGTTASTDGSTSVVSASTSITTGSFESTTASTDGPTSTTTGFPTDTTTTAEALTFGSNGGITISGVITIPSATLPTSFQSTGTGAFVGIAPLATGAHDSFSSVAAAASAIAANPSPSVGDIEALKEQAQENFEQLTGLEAQLKDIDLASLDDDDSHKVSDSLAGLAALLLWFSPQIAAIAEAIETPALAASLFSDIGPAFAAVTAGTLLADALDDLFDLGDGDDDGDDDDGGSTTAKNSKSATSTEESTTATSTETSTTTSATSTCSLIPYTIDLVVDENDIGDEWKRSVPETEEYHTFEKRRAPQFGTCSVPATANIPDYPNYPSVDTIANAETVHPWSPPNKLLNDWVLKWYARTASCVSLDVTWEKLSTLQARQRSNNKLNTVFSVDHIWELKFFTGYFNSFLPAPGDSVPQIFCSEWTQVFSLNNYCLAKKLIRALPSSQYYPEFMAMDQNFNEVKGRMFKAGELDFGRFVAKFAGDTEKTIQALQAVAATVGIMNDPLTIAHFDETNVRVYRVLKDVDDSVVQRGITFGKAGFSFAKQYEDYMADQIEMAPNEAWTFVQKWSGIVETALAPLTDDEPKTQELKANYEAFKNSRYSQQSYYSLGFRTDLAGAPNKREIWERDDSCPFDTTTSSMTTAESTTDSLTSKTDITSTTITSESTMTSGQSTSEGSTTTTDETTTSGETTTEESTASTEQTTTSGETTTGESTTTTEQTTTSSVISTPTTFSTATLSSQSQSSSSEETSLTSMSSTSTYVPPVAQTVTTNGMVCVLYEGSVDPVCTPLETPTANPDGTNVHVASGCILINGSPRCAPDAGNMASVYQSFYNVASDPNEPYSTTLILSGFDSSDDNHIHAKATCQLQARWPANYGDVTFGADGCLYDASNTKIFDQCCTPPDSNNNGPTTNPYVAPAPADPSQSSGNHDGSSICLSLSKDTCLAAASRYVDDVIYHQYTSAVWPDGSGADIVNEILPVVGEAVEAFFGIDYGCTVIWACDDDAAFAQGMTGKQIKDSMLNIYNLNGAKGCGSTYLDNSCHITVNGCNNCEDKGRDSTLWNPYNVYYGTYDDVNDGFPPES